MSRELLAHVFSSLNGLEKTISDVKGMCNVSERTRREYAHDIEQQERVVQHMRRSANKLQLIFAHRDSIGAIRELQIYYGLNAMVRPSVMRIYAELANTKNPFAEVEARITCH